MLRWQSFACICAALWVDAAAELGLLDRERAHTTAEFYPESLEGVAESCGDLAEELDAGFAQIATVFCDPDRLMERALKPKGYMHGLRAARTLDAKMAEAGHALYGGRSGVALTRRTKEPIGHFAEAVAKTWNLTGETSFLIALRGGPHPAVGIFGPGRPETAAAPGAGARVGGWRASGERLATRLMAQGRPGEAVAAALEAIAAAYSLDDRAPAAPPSAREVADDEEAHGLEVEVFGCGHDPLNSTTTTQDLLQEMARIASLKALDEVTYQFEPQGVTSLLMVEESHLAIHTWPEFGYAALDVVSGTGLPRNSIDQLLHASKTKLQCGDVTGKLTSRRHPLSRKASRRAARAAAAAGKREEL